MEQGEILLFLGAHLLLTALPGAAASLLAARRGVREIPILLAIGLAVCAVAGLLGFWTYFVDPVVGETFSFFVLFGSLLAGGYALRGGEIERGLLLGLATPLLLWALGCCFLLMLGYAHGGAGAEQALPTTAARFSHPLPGDNILPSFWAEWFAKEGHHGTPPVLASWHFSDRPPLQMSFALAHLPFGLKVNGLSYEVLGVVLQQLWIVGLWALLLAARVGRLTRALTVVAVLVSDVAIVNGFFIWPKMLPVGLLLGAAALLITPAWPGLRRNLWVAALAAALCALAMLSHGASVFGVIPLLAVAFFRALPSWRWLAVGAMVAIAFLAPWYAYQRYEDPPGDRLTKWTLAGIIGENDTRGTLEATIDSYREAGIDGTFKYKRKNFETMVGIEETRGALDGAFEQGGAEEVIRAIRSANFYYLLPSLFLFLIAPVVMLVARGRGRERPDEWSFALTCLSVFAIGALAWGLISFGNLAARTVLHVGSYLVPLLAICGAVAGLRACFPRFGAYYVAVAAVLSLAVYAPAFEPPLGSSYEPLAIVLCALSLAGFAALAWRGPAPVPAEESGRGAQPAQPWLRRAALSPGE